MSGDVAGVERSLDKAADAIKTDVLILLALSGRTELLENVDKFARSMASKSVAAAVKEMQRQQAEAN